MNYIELSKRLKTAADFVKPAQNILDIGSDHAYLPIYLLQQGKVSKAIAGEVVSGPYHKAIEQVTKYQLEDKIDVRLGDGFEVLEEKDSIGTIFICGMGGLLISKIIQEGLNQNKISPSVRLVLQANNEERHLRNLLMENHFEIVGEEIVKENNKIYEIIVAEYTKEKTNYSTEELIFGPKLLSKQSPLFIEKWRQELSNNQRILRQLEKTKNTQKKETLKKKNKLIEKVIS
jgi:tRNA (adenine22-N1)-methyltransferase